MKTLKVVCNQCEKIVYRSPSSKAKFCSQKCYWDSITGVKKKPNKPCAYCGKNLTGHQRRKGYAKYCSRQCYFDHKKKPFIIKKGYKKILIPNHPRSDGKGYVFEHIIILENKLGRPLKNGEVGHHIDKNKRNNDPENLSVFKNHSLHMRVCHTSSK
jgi:endogenous inhibitor of DNA gyrase (YacG/DUF329 family)